MDALDDVHLLGFVGKRLGAASTRVDETRNAPTRMRAAVWVWVMTVAWERGGGDWETAGMGLSCMIDCVRGPCRLGSHAQPGERTAA